MIQIDTGDTVFHRPSRETWIVACVQDDRLSWVGWPEGMAETRHCLLVKKAGPETKASLLQQMAEMRRDDHRRRYARHALGMAA
ncbi:MAG: hypothetical protein ACPGVG_05355 [Mycobacterium sp.]